MWLQAATTKWHLNELPPEQIFACIFNKSMDVMVKVWSGGNIFCKGAFIQAFVFLWLDSLTVTHIGMELYTFQVLLIYFSDMLLNMFKI